MLHMTLACLFVFAPLLAKDACQGKRLVAEGTNLLSHCCLAAPMGVNFLRGPCETTIYT